MAWPRRYCDDPSWIIIPGRPAVAVPSVRRAAAGFRMYTASGCAAAALPTILATPANRLRPEPDRALATGVDLVYLDTEPDSDTAALKVARAADLLFQARGLATREER